MKKKCLALTLALALVLALAGCGPQNPPTSSSPSPSASPSPSESTEPVSTPTPSPEATPTEPTGDRPQVSLAVLSGPTGMGAAKLLADNDAGATALDYDVTIAASPDEISGKIINGDLTIAAVSTNLAATIYNKTDKGIKMVALNTLGVLYILENGESVQSMADLAGKTLYAPANTRGSNPEYVLNYLLEQNGLTPGEDVTIEWAPSEEITAGMADGTMELCMLPVPAATSVLMQGENVRQALDLTEEWDKVAAGNSVLTMGCLVVQADWAEENPDLLDTFLAEYAASIDYVTGNPDAAAELITQYGITPKAAIAKAAIPQANMVCITGKDMMEGIQGYFDVLWQADPTSIGGYIPDDAFYYIP